MPFYGSIVIIESSGADGDAFPLNKEEFWFGRAEGCDIKMQLPSVIKKHAKLEAQVSNKTVNLIALSNTFKTKLNGFAIPKGIRIPLFQNDHFTIGDRHFR